MMGCDGACAAGFDLVFIGLPLLSLYEIPMLIWFIWRAFHWKRDDKDWLKGTAILAIAVVAPVLLWLSACAPLAVGLVCSGAPLAVGLGMRGLVDTGDRILVKDN